MHIRDVPVRTTIAIAAGLLGCQRDFPHRQHDAAMDSLLLRDVTAGDDAVAKDTGAPTDALLPPLTIVRTTPEPWGANCARGGVRVETAVDYNRNGIIDSADSAAEQFVCNVYPVSVGLGSKHGCALASNATVWCWGADDLGQLGDYGQYAAYAPRPVSGVETALALGVGGDFACVILPTRGVRCWGSNDRGQCGHGAAGAPYLSPSCVLKSGSSFLGATALALGSAHACAALADGSIECWGANDAGQLGDGSTVDRGEPVPVLGIAGAQSVTAGGRHSCALLTDSTVRCWGANDHGQLGDGTTTGRLQPITVSDTDGTAPLAGVAALAAGDVFTCARMQDGTVLCWGANADCQLGQPAHTADSAFPMATSINGAASLVAGSAHICALSDSGKAACWGKNHAGQLGAPAGECRTIPVEIPLPHVLSMAAGRANSCVIDEIGLWCWGDDSSGQLGIGIASAARSTPEPQPALWPLAL